MTISHNSRVGNENRTENPRSTGWRCGSCHEFITRIEDGWVEWLSVEGEPGVTRLKGLRLVHVSSASPRVTPLSGCQYDFHHEFKIDQSIVEGLSLERFVGCDGLMLLLSFFATGE